MNSGSDVQLENRDDSESQTVSGGSRNAVAIFLVLLAVQIAVYFDSYSSMVQIWWRSETFAHGFLIFPISLYLIWTRREALGCIHNQPDYRALPLLAGCGFVWLLAHLADVLVIKQFAIVSMIPLMVWAVFGFQKVWAMAFPLAFMLFAVPAGEFLVAPMMEFTADFTVAAIELTGIPVFREGLFFTLPSGSWSVVEACSGVRYIIASLTLGCLYAYLTYHSYWRRACFILLAIAVPIIANGLRAYMIVMIGHLSSMKLATGVDHLIYGWVWFGIVMFLMFWLGSFWRDKEPEKEAHAQRSNATQTGVNRARIALACAFSLVLIWPIWAYFIGQLKTAPGYVLQAPDLTDWQRLDTKQTDWQPNYIAPSRMLSQFYQKTDQPVGLVLAYYENQMEGAELINSRNTLLDSDDVTWRQTAPIKSIPVSVDGNRFAVEEVLIKSNRERLLVWRWNHINGVHTANKYYGKAIEAWSQLVGQPRTGTGIVLYTSLEDGHVDLSRQRLNEFLEEALPNLVF